MADLTVKIEAASVEMDDGRPALIVSFGDDVAVIDPLGPEVDDG